MTTPLFFLPPLTLSKKRTTTLTLDLYTSDGSPLPIASDDQVRAKIWDVDGTSPEIEISTDTTPSAIAVDELGDAGTPARVTIKFHQTDTDGLTPGTAYYFELFLVDHSDSDLAKPLCRADVVVLGTATGDIGA